MEVSRNIIVCLLMIITMGYYITEGREPVLHRVGGGRFTWKPEVNFTNWTSNERFYEGDWLYFGFDKHIHNVLEVNKTNYEKCIDSGFINNITRGGRDVFQLLEARSYYFMCGRGFCFNGMKVEIIVEPHAVPLSQTISNKGYSTKINDTGLVVFLAIIFVWTLM